MPKTLFLKLLFATLLSAGLTSAQEKSAVQETPPVPEAKSESAASTRKAYDALYSDIIRTLPQEGRSKVDSARGRDDKGGSKKTANSPTREALKKDSVEKRKRGLDELPPEVKARVDKVMSDLDNRRKEKQTEFKELKE